MTRFLTGVFVLMEEECRAEMLHDNMDISRLMVYSQQVEESRIGKKNSEVKTPRTDYGNFTKGKSEGQGRPRFNKRFSNRVFSSAPRVNKYRVSNPKPQGGNGGGSSMTRPTFVKF